MKKAIYKYENKINHKIYIGQTNDIVKRHREHLCGTKSKKISLIDKAIRKYGIENFTFDIIEWTEEYNEREQYWIQYYRSKVPYGYNVVNGGGYLPNQQGENHSQVKITEEIARNIQKDLMNYNLTRPQIVKKYKVTYSIVENISNGHTWNYYNLDYPLRPTERELNELRADKVIDLLKKTSYSFKEIGRQVGWGTSTIGMINNGKNHYREKETYPIRKNNWNYNTEKVKECIKLLKEKKTNAEIAKILGTSTTWVSSINSGKAHRRGNEIYPIRK